MFKKRIMAVIVFFITFSIVLNVFAVSNPTKDFTSNFDGTAGGINLIKTALNTNNTYSEEFLNNFNFIKDYKSSDNNFILYCLTKNLEIPTATEVFEITADNPATTTDSKIMYILSRGYNNTNNVNTIFSSNKYPISDNYIKEYITQMALFLYIYEHKTEYADSYCAESIDAKACDFYLSSNKTTITSSDLRNAIKKAAQTSGYAYLNYIIELVDAANNIDSSINTTINLTTENNGTYYIADELLTTEIVTPTVSSPKGDFINYKLSLKDPNNYGAYLIDDKDNKIIDIDNYNGKFKLVIPIKNSFSEMDFSSVNVTMTANLYNYTGNTYNVTKSPNGLVIGTVGAKKQKYQEILGGVLPVIQKSVKFSVRNIVKISKLDATNSKELPGATLVITDKNNSENTWTFVSTNEPHYMYLPDGDYNLCETIAPEGYALNTTCVDFTVVANKASEVKIINELETPVPNTLKTVSVFVIVIGILSIIFGNTFIFKLSKKV